MIEIDRRIKKILDECILGVQQSFGCVHRIQGAFLQNADVMSDAFGQQNVVRSDDGGNAQAAIDGADLPSIVLVPAQPVFSCRPKAMTAFGARCPLN